MLQALVRTAEADIFAVNAPLEEATECQALMNFSMAAIAFATMR
jgi:hypothetical protein